MTRIPRKAINRTVPGWRFDTRTNTWVCDQHSSPKCSVCERTQLVEGDVQGWLIAPDGEVMPEPTLADVLPARPEVVESHDGKMPSTVLAIDLRNRELVDLTSEISTFCEGRGDGLVNVFLRHATAGLALIEIGHGTEHDVLEHLEKLAPLEAAYGNVCGKGDEGADHLMPVMLSPCLTLPVIDSAPAISSTQAVVLIDRFYPVPRLVRLSFLSA